MPAHERNKSKMTSIRWRNFDESDELVCDLNGDLRKVSFCMLNTSSVLSIYRDSSKMLEQRIPATRNAPRTRRSP